MDKVFIKDLEVETIIGIFGWEREVKQKVRISMEMSFDISMAGKTDKIDDALDYKKIGKSVVKLVSSSSFFLVEKMAEEIAKLVLKDKKIAELRLCVEKPGALRGSKSVGVEIFRCQK
ncbi:MAG: dihydroneopterin aldolase [Proteobacteria bacterium]|jgi:dihydroneopterin aldolase|nr:dihydroneopterin aldolase [Pseudomonadota bacterium]RZO98856.1 MAG: dihydroneopterin aldolase [Gammaproteobacteria bacterium]|tara:strand:+ start:2076 stop:2429 length:354 start_codon:yes stop_codon:yes gene_type:complete